MIEEYILKSKEMKNISEGGSCAYDFGDYVLVQYACQTKYGIARDKEESVMEEVNKLSGINTPLHVEVKRIDEGNINYCYVLQEKAKGISFAKYCNNKPEMQI